MTLRPFLGKILNFIKNIGVMAALVSALIGVMGFMFAVYQYLDNSIERKIDSKLKNPDFVQMIADKVRLPFVIFDEDMSVIFDNGAMGYVDGIEIRRGERNEITEIIISPKKFMPVPPILENLDAKMEFDNPTRGKKFELIYRKIEMATVWSDRYAENPPKRKFRLHLVMLP